MLHPQFVPERRVPTVPFLRSVYSDDLHVTMIAWSQHAVSSRLGREVWHEIEVRAPCSLVMWSPPAEPLAITIAQHAFEWKLINLHVLSETPNFSK